MDSKEDKKLNVSFDPGAIDEDTYDVQLIKFDEKNFHINFAKRSETDDAINIEIKKIISIPANTMRVFCYHIINGLLDYEKKYKNGLGLKVPKKDSTGNEKTDKSQK